MCTVDTHRKESIQERINFRRFYSTQQVKIQLVAITDSLQNKLKSYFQYGYLLRK